MRAFFEFWKEHGGHGGCANALAAVQVVRDAKELASLLEKYLLLTDNDKKQILVEFEKRLGASQLVVEWLEQSVNLL